jgi:hypothetical protein
MLILCLDGKTLDVELLICTDCGFINIDCLARRRRRKNRFNLGRDTAHAHDSGNDRGNDRRCGISEARNEETTEKDCLPIIMEKIRIASFAPKNCLICRVGSLALKKAHDEW